MKLPTNPFRITRAISTRAPSAKALGTKYLCTAPLGITGEKSRVFSLPLIFSVTLTALSGCGGTLAPDSQLEVATKGLHTGALSDRGDQSVIGSINHGGSYWKNNAQERLYNWNHRAEEYTTIVAADFSQNDHWAITANPFNLVLWDTRNGRGERFWTAPGEILDVELGPNANSAILGHSDHTAVIFDIRRGGIRQTFNHTNRVRSVDLSRDGKLAITGSEDYTASLWDVRSGEKISTLKHEDDVQLVKLSPNGELALSVSKYDKALVWNTDGSGVIGEIPLKKQHIKRGIRFTSARFSENNDRLITGRPDQLVELWELPSLQRLAAWKLPKRSLWKPTSAAVLDVAFGEQRGTFHAIASNGFVYTLSIK